MKLCWARIAELNLLLLQYTSADPTCFGFDSRPWIRTSLSGTNEFIWGLIVNLDSQYEPELEPGFISNFELIVFSVYLCQQDSTELLHFVRLIVPSALLSIIPTIRFAQWKHLPRLARGRHTNSRGRRLKCIGSEHLCFGCCHLLAQVCVAIYFI
jgi:hypothetical protein